MASPFSSSDFYVSTQGNDKWSGKLPKPNAAGTDGPFASITAARDAVRKLKAAGELAGPLTVWLREGRYALSAPLAFDPEDSAPVTYAAYPGEQPIIDGGVRVTGWRTEQVNGVSAWVTDVAPDWHFRELFVSGQRRPRARLPKSARNRSAAISCGWRKRPISRRTQIYSTVPAVSSRARAIFKPGIT